MDFGPREILELLEERIEKAKELLTKKSIDESAYIVWENVTKDYLIKIYGPDSWRVDAVINAPSNVSLNFGKGDGRFDAYLVSKIENQIKMLENFVKSFEPKLKLEKGEKNE